MISPWISIAVLAIAAVFEATSFRIAYREYWRAVRGRPTRLWNFIKASKDPALFSVLLEDFAALIGICFAAAGVIAASLFHIAWADGLASIAIGLLLASVAFVLGNETRSLIAGEAVAPIVMERLKAALSRIDCITSLDEVATLSSWTRQNSGRAYPCLPPGFHDGYDRRGDPRGHRGTSQGG